MIGVTICGRWAVSFWHIDQDALFAHLVNCVVLHLVQLRLLLQILQDPLLDQRSRLPVDLWLVSALLPFLVELRERCDHAGLVTLSGGPFMFMATAPVDEILRRFLQLASYLLTALHHFSTPLIYLWLILHLFFLFAYKLFS